LRMQQEEDQKLAALSAQSCTDLIITETYRWGPKEPNLDTSGGAAALLRG
jgi:hypothetical protein